MMKIRILLTIGALFILSDLAIGQISLGFKIGSNYSYYIQDKTDYLNNTTPGWGTDAGLVLNVGDNHLISFRTELLYSLEVNNADINFGKTTIMPTSRYHVIGEFFRHNLLILPQIQLNFTKKPDVYLAFGPWFQYTVASSGKGTYSYFGVPKTSFKGNSYVDSRYILTPYNVGASLGIGVSRIRLGKISLFGELRETAGFTNIYKKDYAIADWMSFTTSVSVGIEFLRLR